jgi:hypothetical protein
LLSEQGQLAGLGELNARCDMVLVLKLISP